LVFLASACAVFSHARTSRADTDTCIADYDAAVTAKRAGQLRTARTKYAACAVVACPAEVRAECQRGVDAVGKSIPTLVFAARGESGKDVSEGRLELDGKEVPNALGGLPVEVDPGEHRLTLTLPNGRTVRRTIVARAGSRNRLVRLDAPLRSPRSPEPHRVSSRSPLGPILLAVGAVGLGSFGVFALLGRQKESELEECAPRCAPDEISKMQRLYLVADISLAVSVVALGAGTYLMLQSDSKESASLRVRGSF
jgi:hypothetical protein